MAYTAETELYGGLNLTMRTKGGLQEKKLVVYGEYIYHLSEAICACLTRLLLNTLDSD